MRDAEWLNKCSDDIPDPIDKTQAILKIHKEWRNPEKRDSCKNESH